MRPDNWFWRLERLHLTLFSRPDRATTKKTCSSAIPKNSTQSSSYMNIFSLHIVIEAFFSAYPKEKGRKSISVFYDNAGLTFYFFTSSPPAKLNLVFATHIKHKSVIQTCSSQDGRSSALLIKYSRPLHGSFAYTFPEQFKL